MPRGPFREETTVVAAAAAQAIKIGNGLVDVLFFGPTRTSLKYRACCNK